MPTSEELRAGPYLKLKRARHHINDLSGQIDAFLAQHPFKLIVQFKRKAGQVVFRTKTDKPIPPCFSLIIGDAVHNLRSALDLTIFGMVKDRRNVRLRDVQFPFVRKKNGLERAIEKGQIEFAGEKVVKAVHDLQPYCDGNKELWGLNSLDARDKHRLLVIARYVPELSVDAIDAVVGKIAKIRLIGKNATITYTGPEDKPILVFGANFVTRNLANTEKEADVQPAFGVCFGEGLPFENCLIIETLHSLTKETTRAVDNLIDAYVSQG